ncbi:hypothetical protein OIO90_005592 [Microbotryomycetes sp. JL221]|nr:hypothetical protein OIO90_005592 [Microbotryomycetes sp. JL221]
MSRQPFGRPMAPRSSPPLNGPGLRGGSSGMHVRALEAQEAAHQASAGNGAGNANQNKRGVLNLVGLAQPHLDIKLDESVLFLHPAPPDQPAQDPIVQGTVTLRLPKKRTLNHLTVRLVGRQDISWAEGKPLETHTTLDKEVSLFGKGKRDVELDKGEHKFEFSIIVPSSTACCERCKYGKTRHSVFAKAKGLGQLGTDILSTERAVFLIANPGGAGLSSPPPSLDYRFEGVLDDIGPYTMALQSQHVMVSGLLLFRFNLVSPPVHVAIYSIKVKVHQYYTLHSPTDINRVATPPPEVRTIMVLDGTNEPNYGAYEERPLSERAQATSPRTSNILRVVRPNEEYMIHHLGRFPDDIALRPSTQEWSETCIRIRHEVAMEVTYRVMKSDEAASGVLKAPEKTKGKERERIPDRKKLVVSKPIEIFSCCCFVDSLSLPPYALIDPIRAKDKAPLCMCEFSMGDVIKYHGQELLREEGEPGLTYAAVSKPPSPGPATPGQDPTISSRPRFGGFFRTDSTDRLSPLGSPMSPGSRSPTAPMSPDTLSPNGHGTVGRDYFSLGQ